MNETKTVFYKFFADWCTPCKIVTPVINALAHEMPDITFIDVNIDDPNAKPIVEEYGIMSIPTVVVVRDGEVVAKGTAINGVNEVIEYLTKEDD